MWVDKITSRQRMGENSGSLRQPFDGAQDKWQD